MNRELELPPVVQYIAVISSANAAGYQDFMQELQRSPYHFHTVLFSAVMQGTAAEASAVAALEAIAESGEEFDAVVIIRGGGSQSDLACFDGYHISSNIAQFPLPVITGIGHDKDMSVADLVANLSMKTPTAVAGTLVERAAAMDGLLEVLREEIAALAQEILAGHRQALENEALRLGQLTMEAIHAQQLYLAGAGSRLVSGSREALNSHRSRLENLGVWLSQTPAAAIRENLAALRSLKMQLASSAGTFVDNRRQSLDLALAKVSGSDPRQILRKGYAIVRGGKGALKDARSAKVGESVTIELHRGSLTAEVKSKNTK